MRVLHTEPYEQNDTTPEAYTKDMLAPKESQYVHYYDSKPQDIEFSKKEHYANWQRSKYLSVNRPKSSADVYHTTQMESSIDRQSVTFKDERGQEESAPRKRPSVAFGNIISRAKSSVNTYNKKVDKIRRRGFSLADAKKKIYGAGRAQK